MIEDIKLSLVFSALIASAMHVLVHYASGGVAIPFAADIGFLACAFIPSFIAVRRLW